MRPPVSVPKSNETGDHTEVPAVTYSVAPGGVLRGDTAYKATLCRVKQVKPNGPLALTGLCHLYWKNDIIASQEASWDVKFVTCRLGRLQRMEEAATGLERRHITQLLRQVKEAIDAALAKLEVSKADALASQP